MRAFTSRDLFFIICVLSICVTAMVYGDPDRFSEHKIELIPLHISGTLNDILIISLPEIPTFAYYLTNPAGDTIRLNITSKTNRKIEEIGDSELETKYKILDSFEDCLGVNICNKNEGVYNEFMIGPLNENDHGNWVLNAYVKVDGGWMEIYQIVTIDITEHIPIIPPKPKLNPGETFELHLAYPIEDLESCELVAPRSAFDRSYDRSGSNIDSCGFEISNVTKADEGLWKIIGVGRIIYESTVFLGVNDIF